jgi:carbohydrate kinase (thermoresistant glucokinase family)
VVLVIMGVSGAGKSTVGTLLAERLGWTFEEGDHLHPLANVEKMAAGIPLTDEDRWPWLARIADWIDGQLDTGSNGVITCSALKHSYRALINRRGSGVEFVYLAVSKSDLEERVTHRDGHFMPASLLDSQLETLEPPTETEPAIRVDAGPDATLVVDRLLRDLGLASKVLPVKPKPKPASAPRTRKPPAASTAKKRTPRPKS